jgi:hypothetical protein
MKFIRIFLLVLIIIGVGLLFTQKLWVSPLVSWILSTEESTGVPVSNTASVFDYKNASYRIEGQPVTLVDGRAETPVAPGSASKVVTQYFGNEATGDLNNDGLPDRAFILTQNSGGSGTFYYAVVALKTVNGYQGTNAVLLGDRIAPQTTEIKGGQLIVNYADRAPDSPMTAQPSIGVSKYLRVEGATLKLSVAPGGIVGSPRACTMEAKLCPDGSAVGRTGPNCEFAPCPTTTN